MRHPRCYLSLVFSAALAAVTAFCGSGCRPCDDSLSSVNASELRYAAAERAESRQAQLEAGAAHLEDFVAPLDIRDGVLSISLEDAVRRTLKNNLDIQIAAFTPAIAETEIIVAASIFDPIIFLQGNMLTEDRPVTSVLATGGADALIQDTRVVSTGIRKPFATGGSMQVSNNLTYLRTNSTFVDSPSYATDFTVELTQPLLRGMGLDVNKAQIYIATNARDATLEQFRQAVMDTLVQVEAVYWELLFTRRDVGVRRQGLELAREVLRVEEARYEQRLTRKLEVSRALAAVAVRQAELIRTESRVRDLSDQLITLINDPQMTAVENLQLLPTDEPPVDGPPLNYHGAIMTAIERRPELQQQRAELRSQEHLGRFYRNQLLPRLDFSFLWRRNSLGGDFGDAFKDELTGRYTDYSFGLVFEVPIGNRRAEAEQRRNRLEYEQRLLQLERSTRDVILEVNTMIREIETNIEEIAATRQAEIAAADTLEGEKARYEVGEVTNTEYLRAQRDFEEAQRNHLQATTRLSVALIRLQRAQGSLLEYNNIHVVPEDYDGCR